MRFAPILLFACIAVVNAEVYKPVRIEESPVIDGNLDEPVWKQALVVSDFLQRYPTEGSKPTEQTEVLLLYTRQSLFIGFHAQDRSAKAITATVMQRDDSDIVNNDQFAFAIDSYNDERNGYWFSTNPLGARVDAQFFEEGDNWEPNWNGIWNCKTKIETNGWTAEIEIPFSTLRFKRGPTNTMGINFFRRIIRTNESLFAPLIPLKYSNGTPNVSAARKYEFKDISGEHPWNLKPHIVSGINRTALATATDRDAGIDVRYALTDSLRSNLSLNTDFAEAEVDERQINLSRFRLFYPEKRDFFLENAGSFQFGSPGETEVFFSRRIGLTDEGETVPMIFGGKLTGKMNRFELGLLNAQTNETSQAPDENFSVFRAKAAVGSRSYVGGIFTNRWANEGGNKDGYGVDCNLYLKEEIALNAYAASSSGSSFKDDSAFYAALGRGGERTSFRVAYSDIGANFNPPIGFVERTGIRKLDGSLFVPFYLHSKWLRSVTPGIQLTSTEDLPGNFTDEFQRASIRFVFPTEDQIELFAERTVETIPEPFPVFREINIESGHYKNDQAGLNFNTKAGRSLVAGILFSNGAFYDGARDQIEPSVQWKINRHFVLSQFFSINQVRLPSQAFTLTLIRSGASYSLNTHLSIASLFQFDNSTQQLGVNVRFSYLFREGTELFVVYDDLKDDRLINNRRLLVKFTYLFDL